jgi:hypothetical protein
MYSLEAYRRQYKLQVLVTAKDDINQTGTSFEDNEAY